MLVNGRADPQMKAGLRGSKGEWTMIKAIEQNQFGPMDEKKIAHEIVHEIVHGKI